MILASHQPAHVRAVGLSFPTTVVDRDGTRRALEALFPAEDRAKIRAMVDRSGVRERRIVPSLDEILNPTTFGERNEAYRRAAVDLSVRACGQALRRAAVAPEEIDVLIDVSCTGITIPALDVEIVPRAGLRADVRRIPITEAGCAGGALALNVAAGLAAAGAKVLVVAVELCSLSLVPGDRSRTNLVASILFGDGAAAAVVTPEGPGPRFHAMHTYLIPNTSSVMGFDVGAHGLRIVLDRELPGVVAEHLPLALGGFLRARGLSPADIGVHLVHPGGRSILDAYQARFGLEPDELRHSRGVLADRGNLSSASILAVLERAMGDSSRTREGWGLMLAIGPGLSLEMALLSFQGEVGDPLSTVS